MTKQLYMAYEQHADTYDAQNKLSVQMTTEVKFVGHRTEEPQEQQQQHQQQQPQQRQTKILKDVQAQKLNLQSQQQQQQQQKKCANADIGKGKSAAYTSKTTAGNLNKCKTTLVDETVKRHYVANDKILFEHRKYDDIKFEQFEVYKHFPEDEIGSSSNNNNNITNVDKQRTDDDMGYELTTKCQGQINNSNNNNHNNKQNRTDYAIENCIQLEQKHTDEEEEDQEKQEEDEEQEEEAAEDCYDSLDDKL